MNKFTQLTEESKSKVLVNLKAFNFKAMRISVYLLFVITIFIGCGQGKEKPENETAHFQVVQDPNQSFGKKITASNAISASQMQARLRDLKPGDTISAKFTARVEAVCKMKGCWMNLRLPANDEVIMVKFKDYGFFVPKNIESREVIVEGLAFIEETSVEDQRHFAQDAGLPQEEIDAIVEVEKNYAFLATGVLLKP